MENKSIVYEFSLSAPYPDENGVSMQGTAYRIESWQGKARADNVKEATGYILRHETIKKVFEYNNLQIEEIINGVKDSQAYLQSIIVLNDTGLTVNLVVKQEEL